MKFLEITEICIASISLILLILIYKACLNFFEIEDTKYPLLSKLFISSYFDQWQLSHFIVYMIAASLYPHYKYTLLILGIIWEIIEVLLGHIYPDSNGVWWYGTYKDIIANGLGILVGVYLLNPIYKYF